MGQQIHPGVILDGELKKRGWTQADLTFILGCHPKAVNQIINGKQGVSAAMSKALGAALALPADYFANLQRAYDVSSANEPDEGVRLRAAIQQKYPIREMIRRGWIRGGDADELSRQLADFFQVASAGDIPHLAHAAKKTDYESEIAPAQLAWLFRVRQVAKSIAVPKYSERALSDALPRLRELLIEPEEARHVPRALAECGIRYAIVEALPAGKIDGVCFWLENSPVIGMSMRFDRIDNFWFVLRHEIEHALREHGRDSRDGMIDILEGENTGTGTNVPEEERIANAAAQDFCVPHEKMESFIHRKMPFFYERDVLAFAKLNHVHPGLPIGQIQRRTGRYDYLKKYQTKIRQHVLPGAIVDGWDRPLDLS